MIGIVELIVAFSEVASRFYDKFGMVLVGVNLTNFPMLWVLTSASLAVLVVFICSQQVTISFFLLGFFKGLLSCMVQPQFLIADCFGRI